MNPLKRYKYLLLEGDEEKWRTRKNEKAVIKRPNKCKKNWNYLKSIDCFRRERQHSQSSIEWFTFVINIGNLVWFLFGKNMNRPNWNINFYQQRQSQCFNHRQSGLVFLCLFVRVNNQLISKTSAVPPAFIFHEMIDNVFLNKTAGEPNNRL